MIEKDFKREVPFSIDSETGAFCKLTLDLIERRRREA